MRYLLDTHVVLWIAKNAQMLSERARDVLIDINNEHYISVASVWEVAIKQGTTKLELTGGVQEFYKIINKNGLILLPIKKEHLLQVPNLPNHHKDPFDRMIIATAMSESMTLITVDENIHKYKLPLLW